MSLGEVLYCSMVQQFFHALGHERDVNNLKVKLPTDGNTVLHRLCRAGVPPTKLHEFLEKYAGSVDPVDPISGVTPLVIACKYGNLDSVKLLVERGANVNHCCSGATWDELKYDNVTPLYVAVEEGYVSVVDFLAKHGADVNVQMSPLGFTPVHRAVIQKDFRLLSLLIEKFNARVGIPCIERPGAYPVCNAVITNDISILGVVLSAKDADPNVPEPTEHVTALHLAAYKGYTQAAEILIAKGANINAQLKSGHSPLDLAVQEKNKHLAEIFRERGARRKILDKSWHPFVICVSSGLHSMKTAVSRGADINSLLMPKSGTALHANVLKRRMDACKFLLRKGADIESRDIYGQTPLHVATDYGVANLVEFLLDRGANINAQTDIGFSPLHRAVLRGYPGVCKLLIDRGADVQLSAGKMGPPIFGAVQDSNTAIVKMLLKAGADPNATNFTGSGDRLTVIQVAVQFAASKPEMIKALVEAGADVRAPMTIHHGSLSCLHIVPLITDNIETLKILIEAGAYLDSQAVRAQMEPIESFQVHYRGRVGCYLPLFYSGPPLKCIRRGGCPALIQLLENTDLLFKAVRKNDLALVAKYFSQGGLVNCCSIRYDTPLIYASWKGYIKMVKFLLENGAKIDMPNLQNSSPLHYAAKYNQKEVAIELLKAGASVDLVLGKKTPLDLAKDWKRFDVIAVLEFAKKYLVETRLKKIQPVLNWRVDSKIAELASEYDGKVSEKDLKALFEA